MSIRVVLADDHEMMREALRMVLRSVKDLDIAGEAADGNAAVALVARLSPDLVIMDMSMPDLNGLEATRQIRRDHPHVKVIGLSALTDRRYVSRLMEAGASGFILKASAGEELVLAVRTVSSGGRFVSPELGEIV